MIKDQWIQKAKALLFDMQFNCESDPLNKEAATLIEEAGGYDPYTETSSTTLEWEPGFMLSLEDLENANVVGEVLREWAFQEPYGLYSCFDVIHGFVNAKDDFILMTEAIAALAGDLGPDATNYDLEVYTDYLEEIRQKMSIYYNETKKVLVAWYWDGDGELYFNADGVRVINTDCKKDYTWEFLHEQL